MTTEALRAEAATLAGLSRNPFVLRRKMDIDEELDARRSRECEARLAATPGRTLTPAQARARIDALK